MARTWYVLALLLCLPSSVLAFVTPPVRAASKAHTQPQYWRTAMRPSGGRENRVAAASKSARAGDQESEQSRLKRFHESLLEAKVSGKVLQLAHPSDFIQDAAQGKLFVRDCYDQLWDLIRDDPQRADFVITGSPQIGKSYFALFVLYKLLGQGKTVIYQAGDLGWFRITDYSVEHEGWFRSDTYAWFFDSTSWVLCDPPKGKIVRPRAKCRKVAFVSFNFHIFADMQNHGNQNTKVRYMPPWNLGELLECRKCVYPNFAEDTVRAKFEFVGGLAGRIFDPRSPQECRDDMRAVTSNMSPD